MVEQPAPRSSRNGATAERPTAAAELKISLTPAAKRQAKKFARAPSAKPGAATVLGIVGSTLTATAGAVLTVAIYHGFVVLAVAELALGFLTALLITAVDFQHSKADLAEKRLEGDIDLKRISSGRNSLCRPV